MTSFAGESEHCARFDQRHGLADSRLFAFLTEPYDYSTSMKGKSSARRSKPPRSANGKHKTRSGGKRRVTIALPGGGPLSREVRRKRRMKATYSGSVAFVTMTY